MKKVLTIFYIILVMVLISLNETYSITRKIFYPELSEESYSTGMDIKSPGFLIHLILFSLLVSLPVFVKL
jgi:hypothetical protein